MSGLEVEKISACMGIMLPRFNFLLYLFSNHCVFVFVFLNVSIGSFCILWMASIVDLWVFWQPDSVTTGVELLIRVFESNKYLLLLAFSKCR